MKIRRKLHQKESGKKKVSGKDVGGGRSGSKENNYHKCVMKCWHKILVYMHSLHTAQKGQKEKK